MFIQLLQYGTLEFLVFLFHFKRLSVITSLDMNFGNVHGDLSAGPRVFPEASICLCLCFDEPLECLFIHLMLQVNVPLQRIYLLIDCIILIRDHSQYVCRLIQVVLGGLFLPSKQLRHGLYEEFFHIFKGIDTGGVSFSHQCHYLLRNFNGELSLARHLIYIEQYSIGLLSHVALRSILFFEIFDIFEGQFLGYLKILLCLCLLPNKRIQLCSINKGYYSSMIDLSYGLGLIFECFIPIDETFKIISNLKCQIKIVLTYRFKDLFQVIFDSSIELHIIVSRGKTSENKSRQDFRCILLEI